jgi:hypothetical protein
MTNLNSISNSPINKKVRRTLNKTHILDPSPSTFNLYDDPYLDDNNTTGVALTSPTERFVGHKTALSQVKPAHFTKQMFDPHRQLEVEVTNNSNLPLKITDAKLLFMKDWKREKDLLI